MRTSLQTTIVTLLVLLVSACSLEPGKRNIDPDEEFAKLDSPDVPTVQASLERNALSSLQDGEYKRAIGLYQQLVDTQPQEVRYLMGLAESLRRVNENAAAITFYDQVITKHPGHLDANEGRALALMAQGETEDAALLFKEILERDKTRWRTLNALGILFAVKGLSSEADAYFNEALKHSVDNPSVLNNLGLTQAMDRQYTQAEQSLKTAAKRAQGNRRKHIELNLALVHGIFGHSNKAQAIAEKHLSGIALTNNLGLYAHLANNKELAKSYLNMALSGSTTYYERAWKNLDIVADGEQ